MTIDRQALATDLEQLGLKAIAGAVRRDTISVERVLAQVERKRDLYTRAGNGTMYVIAQEVLDRYSGEGDTSDA